MIKDFGISYENVLNSSQLEAVKYTEGPLLVIAGAGSGKTRTLTYRVAHLVEKGVAPDSILLLTFTRKASQEMLKRASELLDHRCQRVSGGTFHSFANSVLRRYAPKLGFGRDFSILDRGDSEDLIHMLRKESGAILKNKTFPRKQTLANIFSRSVNKNLAIEDVVANDYPHFALHLNTILSLSSAYQKEKAKHNFFDYDDLLVFLEMLLKEHPDIRDRVSSTYRYVMVDEYQDTNKIQADILSLLSSSNKNIMVVGDDSQSIYAFRGANFKNIIRFPEIFAETKVIRLEENYRSIQPILSLTNVIIERASEKYTKILFTRRTGGSTPVLVSTGNENRQSRFVVEKIQELNKKGIPLSQMAVLFRAGFHSFDLEIELGRHGIPFIKVGGFKFVESAHIKDVLAHIKVLSNADDRISWYRILLLLDRIGPKTARSIYEAVLAEASGHSGLLKIKQKSSLEKSIKKLKALFSEIDSRPRSVAEKGEAVLNHYAPILKHKYDDHPKRMRDLEHLLTIMERYDTMETFLTDMALEPPNTSLNETFYLDDSDDTRLVLSTIHSAKGLEWHTVFVIWTLDGRFPSTHALQSQEDLEEELRLMYVAATRAKENLFFTYPLAYDRNSGMLLRRPSRFLDNIPDSILEKFSLKNFQYYSLD
jgi:DNA helicase-2/ATP-dependent DNA helicase PcrA